jgi:rhomboid protease GluP
MFKRQRTGSVVCASCGSLVGVNDEQCYSCGRRNPGLWGFGPALRRLGNDLGFSNVVLYGCCFLYFASLIMSMARGSNVMGGGLFSLLSPDYVALFAFGASGAEPVFVYGRWWTLLSASWLHGSALHILFNMMWVRELGPATGDLYGPSRMVIIYIVGGALGFLASTLAGAYLWWMPIYFLRGSPGITAGASASVFALLGALVCYGNKAGSSIVRGQALNFAIILGIFGLLPGSGIDNYAHAGGFAGGYLMALWMDPLKRERGDHMLMAVLLIAASAVAVLLSILPFILLARR